MNIDKNDAPEGYYASQEQQDYTCLGCDLDNNFGKCMKAPPCSAYNRKDGHNVIFKENK